MAIGSILTTDQDVESRARKSLGLSHAAIYKMVAVAVRDHHAAGGMIVDVGCGEGRLRDFLGNQFERYVGVDAVRYEALPRSAEFLRVNLDDEAIPLETGIADVVAAVEVIEHLENPRAFMRELTRITCPGGWVVASTPNQLSLLSKLTLLLKNQFNAFQSIDYPAHITALLEIDLRRIAAECGLVDVDVAHSKHGRIPLTAWHFPQFLAGVFCRALSDNLVIVGRKRGN